MTQPVEWICSFYALSVLQHASEPSLCKKKVQQEFEQNFRALGLCDTQGGKWLQLFHVLNGCSTMHFRVVSDEVCTTLLERGGNLTI
jgi:hypothetical protein